MLSSSQFFYVINHWLTTLSESQKTELKKTKKSLRKLQKFKKNLLGWAGDL